MPAWPATIPFFLDKSSFEVGSAEGNVKRSQMSIGPAKTRRRSSAGPRPVRGQTNIIDQTQLNVFRDFFFDDILEGALSFTARDETTGEVESYRILRYSIRGKGLGWVISADLERMP